MQSFTRPEHCFNALFRRLGVSNDVPVLLVYVCDAWLGKFGVVHKVSGFTAKDSKAQLA